MKSRISYCKLFFLFSVFSILNATNTIAQNSAAESKPCDEELTHQLDLAFDKNVDEGIQLCLRKLDAVNEKCKVQIYRAIAEGYDDKLDDAKKIYYLQKGLELASTIKYPQECAAIHLLFTSHFIGMVNKAEAKKHLDQAESFYNQFSKATDEPEFLERKAYWLRLDNQKDSFLHFLQLAYQAAEKKKDTITAHIELHNLGNVYMNRGMYKEAIEHLLKSIHYKELIHDKQNLPGTLLLLGNCYKELKQTDLALSYLTKAKNLSREIGNQLYLYSAYFVIAQTYTFRTNWDTAIVFRNADSAIYLAQALKDTFRIAFSKSVKADLMFLCNTRGAEAERYSFEAMTIFEKRGATFNLCNSVFSLGRYYHLQKRDAEAIVQLEKGLKLAKEVSATNLAMSMHKLLSDIYEQKQDYKTALFHHQQYFVLKDSVESGKLKADMVELEKKYVIGKKETEIALLSKEKLVKDAALIQANTKQNFFLITSLILTAFIATGFWAYRKLRNSRNLVAAKNLELDNLNQVKNRLFSIIAHDVKGLSIPFQRASRVLNHHIQKQNFEKTLEVAQQLETNAQSLSNLLDNLLQWSLEQMNGYMPKPEWLSLKNEINAIIESYAGHAQFKKIEISQEIPDDLSIETDKGAFHVIFRNLVANAIKYTENGSIQIKATQENKNIVCHVKDSGTGIDASVIEKLFGIDSDKIKNGTAGEKGSGLGLVLVKKFLDMNGGTINVNSTAGAGTDFVISFPLRVAV